jgi:hypothetical protein
VEIIAMRLSSLLVLPFLIALTVVGCTDDAEPGTEPVAAEEGVPADDPSMAQPPDGAANSAATQPQDEELPGALTDDPFGAPQPPGGTEDAAADGTPPPEGTAPQPPPDDYSGAFESDLGDDATQQGAVAAPDTATTAPAGSVAKKGKGGKKVTRYVNAMLLNIRSKPSLKAPVVRRLLGGAKIDVELHGQYAKLKEGQWCRAKFLSETPTRKVSRAEVDKAWKRGKAKGKSKPGGKK